MTIHNRSFHECTKMAILELMPIFYLHIDLFTISFFICTIWYYWMWNQMPVGVRGLSLKWSSPNGTTQTKLTIMVLLYCKKFVKLLILRPMTTIVSVLASRRSLKYPRLNVRSGCALDISTFDFHKCSRIDFLQRMDKYNSKSNKKEKQNVWKSQSLLREMSLLPQLTWRYR